MAKTASGSGRKGQGRTGTEGVSTPKDPQSEGATGLVLGGTITMNVPDEDNRALVRWSDLDALAAGTKDLLLEIGIGLVALGLPMIQNIVSLVQDLTAEQPAASVLDIIFSVVGPASIIVGIVMVIWHSRKEKPETDELLSKLKSGKTYDLPYGGKIE